MAPASLTGLDIFQLYGEYRGPEDHTRGNFLPALAYMFTRVVLYDKQKR